jgi:hypothetical protein
MATAKPQRIYRNGPRRHYWRNSLIALVVVALLALAVFWNHLQARAVIGSSYAARIACTCRYIEGRGLKDCRKDFEPGMGLVMLSENVPARSVTARVPLLASQTATLRDGAGCVLQSWVP